MGSSGPTGYDPSMTPQQASAAYQGLDPAQQQGYVNQYMGLDPMQQQAWLSATGQADPTGGFNNPNYTGPPPLTAPPTDPNTRPQMPGDLMPQKDPFTVASGDSGYRPPGPGAPFGGTTVQPTPINPGLGMPITNPWDDLKSPAFRDWFNAELTAGRSPGLHWTGSDPTSMYGTYNSVPEQRALKAEYDKLPPEVQAAYVARYMTLTPPEQAQWRNAFGADTTGTFEGYTLNSVTPAGRPNAPGTFPGDLRPDYGPNVQYNDYGQPFYWSGYGQPPAPPAPPPLPQFIDPLV